MPKATQLTVCLEDKPGQGAKMAGALARAKVNILALTVVDSHDMDLVRLVTDNASQAAAALTKAGMKPTRQTVLTVIGPNHPGTLAAIAGALAGAGVNINYAYGSVAKGAAEGMLVLAVNNLDKALAALAS